METDKTRSDLELDRVLVALAERTQTPMGQTRALEQDFSTSFDEVAARRRRAIEACNLHDAGEPLPIHGTAPLGDSLKRVGAGGALGSAELRAVIAVLAMARSLRRYFSMRKGRTDELAAILSSDPTLDPAEEEIRAAFDSDGTLADHASPRLKELRGEYRASRARIMGRLEVIMQRYEATLQDKFITEREGRYVLPVRSDAHGRFAGIVHGASASGSTLFIEPRSIIEMGNRLKVLEAEVNREELAVYAKLTGLLHEKLPSVLFAVSCVAEADVFSAIAKLRAEFELEFPELSKEAVLDLRDAKHLLLLLDGVAVVPSDLAIRAGHGVVISGPNAGGKTVALKTLGLSALMVRAGLPLPAAKNSIVGVFHTVLTDVGDEQSLEKNLSTFSAHIKNLTKFLERTHRGTLVLLDELCGGTDPREGEALAAGILSALASQNGAIVATTHYEGLKALALGDARFRNASVGFDIATLSPTFRLALDLPGSSSALAVAKRFGIPDAVIESAKRFLSNEDKSFEDLVKRLNDERAALELAREAARKKGEELDEELARAKAERERLREQQKQALDKELESLTERLRRAQADLREAQVLLRSKRNDKDALRNAEQSLSKASQFVAETQAERRNDAEQHRAPVDAASLRRGSTVYVPRLGREGEVLDLLPGDQVRVALGSLKLTLPLSDLRGGKAGPPATAEPKTKVTKRTPDTAAVPQALEVALQTSDNTVDLRGLRTEDALSLAMTFLDRAIGARLRVVFLVHGHGTGALRDAIRGELKSSPYVAFFRAGGPNEGGDGATIAWLA
ncbi:MAG: endonuclease MutS2 [Polyangiaceae bacterium]